MLFGLKPWLHVKLNYFEIILKLFQCFISHVTTSETDIRLLQNYLNDTEHVGQY